MPRRLEESVEHMSLAVIRFGATSGIPEDVTINTFHFTGSLGAVLLPLEAARAAALLENFVNADPPALLNAPGEFLNNTVSRGADDCSVTIYNGDETPLGAVLAFETFTLIAAVNAGLLPRECAAVLSHHGVLDGSAADRRKRGRIYWGPLNDSTNDQGSGEARVAADFQGVMLAAAKELEEEARLGAPPIRWTVYSRVGNAHTNIVAGFTDNAFDTQRRRGPDPTFRNTWNV